MAEQDIDARVRAAAFTFLEQQTDLHGEVVSREVLANGFTFEGHRVPLVGTARHFQAGDRS